MEHVGCPFATQEESVFEDELPALNLLSFDPIMVAEQFTLMDAVRHSPLNLNLLLEFKLLQFQLLCAHPYLPLPSLSPPPDITL